MLLLSRLMFLTAVTRAARERACQPPPHGAARAAPAWGYPPGKEEKATLTVLEQAEQIAKDWAE
jgi:hypothetical protein